MDTLHLRPQGPGEYLCTPAEVEALAFHYSGQAGVIEARQIRKAWEDGSWRKDTLGVSIMPTFFFSSMVLMVRIEYRQPFLTKHPYRAPQ